MRDRDGLLVGFAGIVLRVWQDILAGESRAGAFLRRDGRRSCVLGGRIGSI